MRNLTQALQDRPLLGFALSYPAPGLIERIGSDWNFVWIDGQHGQWDYSDALSAVRVSELMGIFSVMRVPDHAYGSIGRALDTGASAVMVPMVNTPDEAREVVNAAKFPPLGCRSYGARRIVDRCGRSYSHTANEDTTLIVQIETPQALDNIEAICAVPGVDVVFYSPDDIKIHRGFPMDQPTPDSFIAEAMLKMAAASSQAGKLCGGPFGTPEAVRSAVKLGYRLINCCTDNNLLTEASNRVALQVKPILDEMESGK